VDECLCCNLLGCGSRNKRRKEVLSKGKRVTFSLHIYLGAPKTAFLAIPCPSYDMIIHVFNKGCFFNAFVIHHFCWRGMDSVSTFCLMDRSHCLLCCLPMQPDHILTALNSILKMEAACQYSHAVTAWCHDPEDYILTTLYFVIMRIFVGTWACRHNITKHCWSMLHVDSWLLDPMKLTGAGM
jgi:hypothetical protein